MNQQQFIKIVPPSEGEVRFVVSAKYKAGAIKALDAIRALFGKNGQNWITGDMHLSLDKGELHPKTYKPLRQAFDGYCLIGGVRAVDGKYEAIAQIAIALAIVEQGKELVRAAPIK